MKKLIILTAILAAGSVMAKKKQPTSCPGYPVCCHIWGNGLNEHSWAKKHSCKGKQTKKVNKRKCSGAPCPPTGS